MKNIAMIAAINATRFIAALVRTTRSACSWQGPCKPLYRFAWTT